MMTLVKIILTLIVALPIIGIFIAIIGVAVTDSSKNNRRSTEQRYNADRKENQRW